MNWRLLFRPSINPSISTSLISFSALSIPFSLPSLLLQLLSLLSLLPLWSSLPSLPEACMGESRVRESSVGRGVWSGCFEYSFLGLIKLIPSPSSWAIRFIYNQRSPTLYQKVFTPWFVTEKKYCSGYPKHQPMIQSHKPGTENSSPVEKLTVFVNQMPPPLRWRQEDSFASWRRDETFELKSELDRHSTRMILV